MDESTKCGPLVLRGNSRVFLHISSGIEQGATLVAGGEDARWD